MRDGDWPLSETSIGELFFSPDRRVYEVPIYQRNYAWGIDEVRALVQDVHDAQVAGKHTYYIGTLVTYDRGKEVYEVIDGQQRLTTIFLLLRALGERPTNELTYSSRTKSTETIEVVGLPEHGKLKHVDTDIKNGYENADTALSAVLGDERQEFARYFRESVHIIFYKVPKDVDLNHYFEVMNSRGEQLERHEVVKANLLGRLENASDRTKFNQIWERCSEMDVYIQQLFSGGRGSKGDYADTLFGGSRNAFMPRSFDELPDVDAEDTGAIAIRDLMKDSQDDKDAEAEVRGRTRFQPIIDFPNFLLIVLKLTQMGKVGFNPSDFTLDDKEIIQQFENALEFEVRSQRGAAQFVKDFGYNLLLSRFFLDNYVVHHTLEEDRPGDNPWKLQRWELRANERGDRGYPVNLFPEGSLEQAMSEQLLSMFEVSFTARQRKNYLFYCLLYLHGHKENPGDGYPQFLEDLARTYLLDVYLGPAEGLNDKNAPIPGSFDAAVLERVPQAMGDVYRMRDLGVRRTGVMQRAHDNADIRFGDGDSSTRGIPLFVFNYLDYRLWRRYFDRAQGLKRGSPERRAFFERLGCGDFGLDIFRYFYFSRTRRSLEHYYPQALQARSASDGGGLKAEQINCLGNFAMIGNDANSSGSDWSPKVKLDHYLDTSGKINRVSVASLKFMVMMQTCRDNVGSRKPGEEWVWEDIEWHQLVMLDVMLDGES